jgi:hypothetical protein
MSSNNRKCLISRVTAVRSPTPKSVAQVSRAWQLPHKSSRGRSDSPHTNLIKTGTLRKYTGGGATRNAAPSAGTGSYDGNRIYAASGASVRTGISWRSSQAAGVMLREPNRLSLLLPAIDEWRFAGGATPALTKFLELRSSEVTAHRLVVV